MRRWMLPAMAGLLAVAGCQPASNTTASADAGAPETPECALTVGWDPWEPYSYEAVDGAVTGLDVDLVKQLGKAAGCRLDFRKGNWVALLGDLEAGKVDLLMAATPTSERRDFAYFSEPYRDESFVLFAHNGGVEAFQGMTLGQLLAEGKRVGITDGYYYGEEAQGLLSNPDYDEQIVPAPVPEANYRHLEEGAVDVVIGDPYVAGAVLRRTGLGASIRQLHGNVHTGSVTLMFSKASVDEQQVRSMNAALDRLESAGQIAGILSRYRGS